MGLFDTVHFTCPKCNQKTSDQTKIGICMLMDYNLDLPISLELAHQLNGASVQCEWCDCICVIGSNDLPSYNIHMKIEEGK